MKTISTTLSLIFVILFLPVSLTYAYIPPAVTLLRMSSQANQQFKDFLLESQSIIYDQVYVQGHKRLSETIYLRLPNMIRCEMRFSDSTKIFISRGEERFVLVDDQVKAAGIPIEKKLLPLLYLYHPLNFLADELKKLGLDLSINSLGRFEGEIVYIIGSKDGYMDRPQLWLEKDTLRPLRFINIANDREGGVSGQVDVRFIKYKFFRNNVWFPSMILVFKSNVLNREYIFTDVVVNYDLEDELFNVDFPESRGVGLMKKEKNISTEELLHDFEKRFRQ